MSYEVTRYDNYLQHFGIKGMHWGQWNEETRARYMGKRKGINRTSKDEESKKEKIDERKKKAIKIGATMVATVFVSYAGVKLATDPRFKSMVKKGMDKINKTPSIDEMIANSGPEIVRKKK